MAIGYVNVILSFYAMPLPRALRANVAVAHSFLVTEKTTWQSEVYEWSWQCYIELSIRKDYVWGIVGD